MVAVAQEPDVSAIDLPKARRADRLGRCAWWAAVATVLSGALLLRMWGLRHGLPFVYNPDEAKHFVPHAVEMFGHSLNPGYFVNPPGFTYVVYGALGLRYGNVQDLGAAFAADPGAIYAVARACAAVLGTISVCLVISAGTRLFDRATGLIAGLLLASAFLPAYYSHLAVNDAPALAPVGLALVGAAGLLRRGRSLDAALAGAGLGLASATKYTAGFVLLCVLAAGAAGPGRPMAKLRRLALAGVTALGAFLAANPYALLDAGTFQEDLTHQWDASQTLKVGSTGRSALVYYLHTTTYGLGWAPAVAAAVGAAGLVLKDRRAALVLVPAPVAFLLFMGSFDRFYGRWLLPVYPVLCLWAAWAAVCVTRWTVAHITTNERTQRRVRALTTAVVAVALAAQGAITTVHVDRLLTRQDTRAIARAWLVRYVPDGSSVVWEPVVPTEWAMDPGHPSPGTRSGKRWRKWPMSRSLRDKPELRAALGRTLDIDEYERTLSPELVDEYLAGGYCWVLLGSTQYGRAAGGSNALQYYKRLRERGRVVLHVHPWRRGTQAVPFSFEASFTYFPRSYYRPGPEIVVYRLDGSPSARGVSGFSPRRARARSKC